MPSATRDGARLFYEDRGSGDPPIVLVPGIGTHTFEAQIEHFQRNHRVVALDLPGFGNSDTPTDEQYGISANAAAVTWLCDELDLRAPTIVGHSMGGAITFEIAAARPRLPSAIVLLDPIPIVPLPALRDQRAGLEGTLDGPGYLDAFRAFAETRMFRATDDPAVRTHILDDMCATPQHVLAPTFASISAWSGEHLARLVECPVLLITTGDGLPADLPRTRELIPGIELGRTVGSGHFAHAFAPEQANAMIDRFLLLSVNANAAAGS